MEPSQAVYLLTQHLALVEQQTHEDPQVTESCEQSGLLLLTSSARGDKWNRELEEYILPQDVLDSARNQEGADRAALRQAHDEIMTDRKIILNLSDPIEIESNAINSDVAIPCRASMVPYNLPTDPLPLPLFCANWPTVTPPLPPAKRMDAGAQWKGETRLQIGAGVFAVTYAVNLVESTDQDYTVEVKIDDQRPTSQAGEITLLLRPHGQWIAKIARANNLWKSARGQMAFLIRANFMEDDEQIEVEVLKCQNVFSLESLPVNFDENKIYTSAWKYQADHPHLSPAPPPPPAPSPPAQQPAIQAALSK